MKRPRSNRRTIFRIAAGILLLFVVLAALALLATRPVDVIEVPPPEDSLIGALGPGADYADAWLIEVPHGLFSDVEAFYRASPERPPIVERSEEEILARGSAPGLDYWVSYLLQDGSRGRYAILSTRVEYRAAVGRLYFTAVRPVHRRIVPRMLQRMLTHPPEADREPSGAAEGP
ncbi:MAG: DUF2867 domain-containing protein [bacterium]|nr:DUF2867 domain-containing protein [bacterium]